MVFALGIKTILLCLFMAWAEFRSAMNIGSPPSSGMKWVLTIAFALKSTGPSLPWSFNRNLFCQPRLCSRRLSTRLIYQCNFKGWVVILSSEKINFRLQCFQVGLLWKKFISMFTRSFFFIRLPAFSLFLPCKSLNNLFVQSKQNIVFDGSWIEL